MSAKEQRKEQKRLQKSANTFASYEEFAHLLDGDSDEDQNDKHLKAMSKNKKRTFESRENHF